MALFESTMSEDITVQYSVLSGGVATVMLKAIKLVETENDQVHAELCEQCHEYLIRKLSEIVTQKENQKVIITITIQWNLSIIYMRESGTHPYYGGEYSRTSLFRTPLGLLKVS